MADSIASLVRDIDAKIDAINNILATVPDIAALSGKVTSDGASLNKVVQGGASETVTLTSGTIDTAAKAIAQLDGAFSKLGFALKDLSNIPEDAIGALGFAGFNKSKFHLDAPDSNINNIDKTSIYAINDSPEAPFQGQGILKTIAKPDNTILQIAYSIIQPATPKSCLYFRLKTGGVFSAWQNLETLNYISSENIDKLASFTAKGGLVYRGVRDLELLPAGLPDQVVKVENNLPKRGSFKIPDLKDERRIVKLAITPPQQLIPYVQNTSYPLPYYIYLDGTCPVLYDYLTQNEDPIIKDIYTPTPYPTGNTGACFMLSENTDDVYYAGGQHYGQAGIGGSTSYTTSYQQFTTPPVKVKNVTGIIKIVTNLYLTFFLNKDGKLWASGWNLTGTLGIGDTTDRSTPVLLSKQDWQDVAIRRFASYGLDKSGVFYAWGENTPLTGDGDYNTITPRRITDNVKKICGRGLIKNDGTVYVWYIAGIGTYTKLTLLGKDIIADDIHYEYQATTMILVSKGEDIYVLGGSNQAGQLGLGVVGPSSNVPISKVPNTYFRDKKIIKIRTLNYTSFNNQYICYALLYDDGTVLMSNTDTDISLNPTNNNLQTPDVLKGKNIIDIGPCLSTDGNMLMCLDDEGNIINAPLYRNEKP